MEVTKWLKPSISVSRIGDSASVQAATRVNAEQASKMSMCRPTRRPFRGRLTRWGERSAEDAQRVRRGGGGSMYTRKARATREALTCVSLNLIRRSLLVFEVGAGGRGAVLTPELGPRRALRHPE